jgi:VanZ family protein
MHGSPQRTLLPHALAALYGFALAYASLQPFAPWIVPAPGTPFWLFAPWPSRVTRADVIANVIAYFPFGFFVASMPRSSTFASRALLGLGAGACLSFAMESAQMYLPPRDATTVDLAANIAGALLGGVGGASFARVRRLREGAARSRADLFLRGRLGDFGIALVALWLAAQLNPGIGLFAVNFEPTQAQSQVANPMAKGDGAVMLVEAAESALQLVGVGLFLTLLLRDRRDVGGALLLLVGCALLAKGAAATFMLKPAVWEVWLRPGVAIGVAIGALILLCAVFLPRPAAVAACAVALLLSLLVPLLSTDFGSAPAPLTLFNWRYGHLLNFNGLTHTVLLIWPLLAAIWLFALAGRPAWGNPGATADA